MTHASRYTTAWESKCGDNNRITHVRDQLGSNPKPSLYGDIVVSFNKPVLGTAKTTSGTVVPTSDPGSVSGSGDDTSTFTSVEIVGDAEAEHVVKIDRVVKALDASFPLSNDFEAKYDAWKATWFLGPMQKSAKGYGMCASCPCMLSEFVMTAPSDFIRSIFSYLSEDGPNVLAVTKDRVVFGTDDGRVVILHFTDTDSFF